MTDRHYSIRAIDEHRIVIHHWEPAGDVRAALLVSHGMAEHGARYAPLGEYLAARGIAVHAVDHRGHGLSAHRPEDLGHFADRDGWRCVVSDLQVALNHLRIAHPGVPVFLLGHSMGSFIAQALAMEHGKSLAGLALSGSNFGAPLTYRAGRVVARLERLRQGKRGKSALLEYLSFGAFNKAFTPARTAYDWLSRDNREVDTYINDPRCGFRVSNQLWIDLLGGLVGISSTRALARIPHGLPVYIFGGDQDPVGQHGKGLPRLAAKMREAGLGFVTLRLYPGGRHEMLNESNRAEVFTHLAQWLDRYIPEF